MIFRLKIFLLSLLILCQTNFSNAQNGSPVYSVVKDANDYYLKALYYIEIGDPRTGGSVDSLKIAVQLLEKAVQKDTLFAKAFLELSRTYWKFDFSYPNRPLYFPGASVILPKSKNAILKAIQIDSTSSEAYTDLAGINYSYEYNWNEVLKNLSKAIRYNPKNIGNYARYGQVLALKGDITSAQKWIDTAYSLAPNDSRTLLNIGVYYYWMRNFKQAIYHLSKIDPQTYISKFYIGYSFIADNNPAKAVETLKTVYADFENADGGAKALLAYALTKNGETADAEKLIKRSYELNQVVKYRDAVFNIGIGKYKKAIDLLEGTYDEHGNWLVWLKYDPALDPIRKEKRFIMLLNKMKYN